MSDQPVLYMLQGFFFQERTLLGLDMRSIDGAVAVVRCTQLRNMFAGAIGFDGSSFDWTGTMTDVYGVSTLDRINLHGFSLTFDKTYDGRDDPIHYSFHKRDGLWVGGYNGELVGSGYANCILTPVPQQMFESAE